MNLAKLRETWSGLETRSQLTLVGSVLAVLVALYMVHSFASKPTFSTLATGLDPAQTGQAEKALAGAGVTYRIANGGTEISVRSGQESQARVALAEKGVLNSGHVGFEIFDKSSLSATDFQQQVNYQRALEGEIAMTIEQIQGVSSANVQLVLPTESLFSDRQTKPTAAVLLNGGSNLDASTLRGIAHLVASSVKGLDVQNVTITDETGSLLWPNGDGGGATADTKLQADNLYASQLAGQINALLISTLGPDKATARVHADLNVDQTTIDKVTYAKKGTPLTTNTDSETLQSKGGGGASLPSGTRANTTPSYAAGAAGAGGQSKYSHSTGSTSFGVDKTIQRSVVAPGTVNRIDVALVVDTSVPKAQVDSLQKSVASLAGITPSRGDTLAVSQLAIAKQAAAATEAKPSPIAGLMSNPLGLARNVLLAMAAIVFLFMIRRSLKRREGEESVPEPTWLRELESGLTVAELEAMPARHALPPAPPMEDPAHEALRTQVDEIVQRQPEAIANQVTTWMKE